MGENFLLDAVLPVSRPSVRSPKSQTKSICILCDAIIEAMTCSDNLSQYTKYTSR